MGNILMIDVMKKQIPDWKQIQDPVKLVYLADINFLICKKIYENIDSQNRDDYYDFLLLTANNAFSESVSIIHGLLCSKKEEEIRIEPLLKKIIEKEKDSVPIIDNKKIETYLQRVIQDYPDVDFGSYTFLQADDDRPIGNIMVDLRKKKRNQSGLADLIELRELFIKGNFHKIRHQAISHKNKYLDNPTASVIGMIYPEYIEKFEELVKKLRINCNIWFDYSLTNTFGTTIKSLESTLMRIFRPE